MKPTTKKKKTGSHAFQRKTAKAATRPRRNRTSRASVDEDYVDLFDENGDYIDFFGEIVNGIEARCS